MENTYNLLDEKWIPIAGSGRASLLDIFSDHTHGSIGGTAIQKISLLKLFLAIAQSAHTPQDDDEWKALGPEGMADAYISYLEKRRDKFWLYGEHPFLQIPALRYRKNLKGEDPLRYDRFRPYLPDVSSANDSILFDVQIDRVPEDWEKALMLVSLMNYAPGGKRVENIGALSESYSGKGSSAKSGPSLGGYVGFLNTCLWSDSILNTIYLNLFTHESIREMSFWSDLSVVPPWDDMPRTEDDEAAVRIKNSIMGSLCALSRFVLFTRSGMIYAEGIQYPSHKAGWRESFFAWNSKDKFLWIDTEKKPWRNLVSLLSIPMGESSDGYQCPQVTHFWRRGRERLETIGVWSGGLQVRGTAGDQSVKQKDDFVESAVLIPSDLIGKSWFTSLSNEVRLLEKGAYILTNSAKKYLVELKRLREDATRRDPVLEKIAYDYWELTGELLNEVINYCEDEDRMNELHNQVRKIVSGLYNRYCPFQSSRQMAAWAKFRPRIQKSTIREATVARD
jgi:CRISPR system Cascade subunit CasA